MRTSSEQRSPQQTEQPDLDVAGALRLPPEPFSPREARRFLVDFCRAAQLPEDITDTAALLVSELVTNAIVHGRSSAIVEVHRPADTLRVAVRDDNPELPPIGNHPELGHEAGRGLLIVAMLAPKWGIEAGEGGKAVWFELTVNR